MQFFGRFTWKDVLRLALPVATAAVLTDAYIYLVLALLLGAILYAVRPFSQPLDHHIIRSIRFLAGRYL
ncbi:hypothetical protein [Haloferax sp. Atlit-24N]|nr:hypothetical protein [Haloferax sp. Atlit-24N]ELY33307.1 transfer complex protein-like protein [Haloferax volcanii DS2]MBS8120616.1 hypothetical protein [Haloferax volcanii]MBS8125653.1 hypothetical protein [Haloferax volcanii]MBS8129662.1 hypothetical protein [Haloferax volcanii]MBS8133527.1 hypothetical protein [Haloferax volcanii]